MTALGLVLPGTFPGSAGAAESAVPVTSYRVATSPYKYHDTSQLAFALRGQAECGWPVWRMELGVGVIHSPQETRPFLSAGPMLCWQLPGGDLFLEAGISPTLIAGSRVEGHDLGGDFHFTSSAAVGTHLGARQAWSVSLRFQHLSNAGINRPNPGLNLIGLDFSYRPVGR